MAFFDKAGEMDLKHAKVASFGSTRRANVPVEEDAQIQLLLDASTPVVTIFGKSYCKKQMMSWGCFLFLKQKGEHRLKK